MPTKTKTILLAYGVPSTHRADVFNYLVDKVTDSTEFHPGQVLEGKTVNELCESAGWKVTIVKLVEG